MDLSEKLKQIAVKEKEAEMRAKKIFKMTERKYELQRKLKDTNTILKAKHDNLVDIRKETVDLGNLLSVVSAKAEIAKENVRELIVQVVTAEKETEEAQTSYWKQVNDFISSSAQFLKKHPLVLKKEKNDTEADEIERKLKLQHLKMEGELEALRSFEKYQNKKIEELKLLKEMLEI